MNRFDDDAAVPLPNRDEIEARLTARRPAVPDAGFRERVVAAMEEAAADRRLMLAERDRFPPRPGSRRPVPEIVAGIAAAIVVGFVPWGGQTRAGGAPGATAAAATVTTALPLDEPPDVHEALAKLDARRDLFQGVPGLRRQLADF